MARIYCYIFVGVLINFCFSNLVRAGAETSSSSEEMELIPYKNTNIHMVCSLEESIKQHLLNDQKLRKLELDELKQVIAEINNRIERKLSKIEDALHDVQDAMETKLHKLERRIIEKLSDYLDNNFNEINAKADKQNQIVSRDLKKISDMQDILYNKIDKLETKIGDSKICSVDTSTLDSLRNISINSSHKLDSLIITTKESNHVIKDTVTAVQKINSVIDHCSQGFGKVTQQTSSINSKINDLINITTHNCKAVEPCPVLPNLPEKPTNESRVIIWNECKQAEIKDTYEIWYDFSKPLVPFDDHTLRHVSVRTACGRLEYLHMRVGVQANNRGDIVLSPEREPRDKGFYFRISVYRTETILGTATAGVWKELVKTNAGTSLSEWQPSAIFLTVFNDTLQLRHEYSSAPFFEYYDPRFRDLKYFWFASAFNNHDKSIFYYDC